MRLLYFYTEFLGENGAPRNFRGQEKIELNFSTSDLFSYDKEKNTLFQKSRVTALPPGFWLNEAVKATSAPEAQTNIYNINVLAGQNGSGKTSVIHFLIDFLDAVYLGVTNWDGVRHNRYDPRNNRSLLLLEGELAPQKSKKSKNTNSTASTERALFVLDYSPASAPTDSNLVFSVESGTSHKLYRFSFSEWGELTGAGFRKKYNYLNMSEREVALSNISQFIRKTKVIYMTNTLVQRDYLMYTHGQTDTSLRDYFIYNCSLGAQIAVSSDRNSEVDLFSQFFNHEIYKQVKYVFDRKQHDLRKGLEKAIPEVRIPNILRFHLRIDQFQTPLSREVFPEIGRQFDPGNNSIISAKRINLPTLLGMLCVCAFDRNLGSMLNTSLLRFVAQDPTDGYENITPQQELENLINRIEKQFWLAKKHNLIDEASGIIKQIIVLPNGSIAVCSINNEITIWNQDSFKLQKRIRGIRASIDCFGVLPEGKLFISESDDILDNSIVRIIGLLNSTSSPAQQVLTAHFGHVSSIATILNNYIAFGNDLGDIYIWDYSGKKSSKLPPIKSISPAVLCLASWDKYLVSAHQDRMLRIWDVEKGILAQTTSEDAGLVSCLAIEDGIIASGSYDNTIRIWDALTGKCRQTLKDHTNSTTSVAFLQKNMLISGSSDNTVRIWDIITGKCIQTISVKDTVSCIAVLRDGVIATAENDKLYIWDLTESLAQQQRVKNMTNNCKQYLAFLKENEKGLFSHFHRIDDRTFDIPVEADKKVNTHNASDQNRADKKEKKEDKHEMGSKKDDVFTDLIAFIQKYRYTCDPEYTIDFDWGLSSGEENMLRLFSNLYFVFDRDYSDERNGDFTIYNREETESEECDTVLLFLDEADLTLHPEWQRTLINTLTAFLPNIYPTPNTRDLQLILSTHSPLLLGDIPRENITYLASNNQPNSSGIGPENSSPGETFGQNIHTILKDSFFLKSGTIGEFAAKKINATAERLQELADSNIKCSADEMDTLRQIVSLIAPGILRAEMDRLLQNAEQARRPKETQLEWLITEASQLSREDRRKLLTALEQKEIRHD